MRRQITSATSQRSVCSKQVQHQRRNIFLLVSILRNAWNLLWSAIHIQSNKFNVYHFITKFMLVYVIEVAGEVSLLSEITKKMPSLRFSDHELLLDAGYVFY